MPTPTVASAAHLTGAAYLAHLRRDIALMAELAPIDLDAAVPRCEGWTVAEVLRHTGEVYARRLATVRSGLRLADSAAPAAAPTGHETLVAWFAAIGSELVDELAARDDDEPTCTWTAREQHCGFWKRRMAHETLVHRIDVQQALECAVVAAPELAVDGIDEVLEAFLLEGGAVDKLAPVTPVNIGVRVAGCVRRVRLAGRWAVLGDPAGPVDATVEGEALGVLLWLWGRVGDDDVSLTGDRAAVAALQAAMRAVTQG